MVESLCLMLKKWYKNDQNLEINIEPQLLTIELGKPWCQTITLRMTSANAGAVIVVCTGL